MTCRICGLHPATRHGRCDNCRTYQRRTGTERPYELIRRQLQREVSRRGP
jgi:predicted ATP-dependent serine protease